MNFKTLSILALATVLVLLARLTFGADVVQAPFSTANLVPLQRFDPSGATDGQVPTFNATLGQWQAKTIGSGPISPTLGVNNLILTNGLFYLTNVWAGGPTGVVDMAIHKQNFRTLTPVSVTGITSKSNYVSQEVLLSIFNVAATNVTMTVASGIILTAAGVKTNTANISAGGVGEFWWQYNPEGPHTNGVAQDL